MSDIFHRTREPKIWKCPGSTLEHDTFDLPQLNPVAEKKFVKSNHFFGKNYVISFIPSKHKLQKSYQNPKDNNWPGDEPTESKVEALDFAVPHYL